jgi:hypothetical protein
MMQTIESGPRAASAKPSSMRTLEFGMLRCWRPTCVATMVRSIAHSVEALIFCRMVSPIGAMPGTPRTSRSSTRSVLNARIAASSACAMKSRLASFGVSLCQA